MDACKHAWLRPHEGAADAAAGRCPPLPTEELLEAVREAQQAVADEHANDDEEDEAPSARPSGAMPRGEEDMDGARQVGVRVGSC